MDILEELNKGIIELNGVRVTPEAVLSNSRLEPYALVVLFYKLQKIYPIYTYEVVLPLLTTNPIIESIVQLHELN